MARFTSIGMGRKSFVASTAEEGQSKGQTSEKPEEPTAGPSNPTPKAKGSKDKKRPRDAERGHDEKPRREGWSRDDDLAKRSRMNADRSADRRFKRQNLNTTNTTCFACRSVGHAARDCPNVLLAAQGISTEGTATLLGDGEKSGDGKDVTGGAQQPDAAKGMKRGKGKKGGDVTGGKCYRCDSTSHGLSHCPVKVNPSNPTPFATCFICLSPGHLSSLCPSNKKGIYVKGGCCKVCGSVAHRANDCPDDKRGKRVYTNDYEDGGVAPVGGSGPVDVGADEDDFMVQARQELQQGGKEVKGKKKKHAPNNNGPREKYVKQVQDQTDSGLPAPVVEAAQSSEVSRPVPASATPADVPKAVVAPTPVAPVRKTKPKVVSF